MFKRTLLSLSVAMACMSGAMAAEYYVLVPVKFEATGSTSNTTPTPSQAISVSLNTYAMPDAVVGAAYSVDLKPLLSVSGDNTFNGSGVTWSTVSSSLPAGLSLRTDGTIAGTPTASGTGSITARATYKGVNGEQTYQVVTLAVTVDLASATLAQGVIGVPYSFDLNTKLNVTGDSAYDGSGVIWSVVSSDLPAGLSLRTDGTIAGTPTAAGAGSVTARATYRGVNGEQTYQVVTLGITVGLAIATPPHAMVGAVYSYDLNTKLNVTGDSAYDGSGVTWSVVSSDLPTGLSLRTDGTIAGTPTASGTGSVTARASYKGVNGEQTYQVVSQEVTVSLATATIPEGLVGQAFSYDARSLLTVNTNGNYTAAAATWDVASGTLPAGLTLNSDGTITGTPTAAANSTVTVRATYQGLNGTQNYQFVTLNVGVALAAASPTEGLVGTAYSYDLKTKLSVTGDAAYNAANVTWAVTSGTLPAGLTLGSNGVVSGTPTAAANSSVTVRATYKGVNGEQNYQFVTLNISVSLATATLPTGTVNSAYAGFDFKNKLTVSGDAAYDVSNVTFSATGLPSGMSLSSAGVLSGTPTVKNATGSSFNVVATYKTKTGQQAYTIIVNGVPLNVLSIAAGSAHTCALVPSGGVKCWGGTSQGQVGIDPALVPKVSWPVNSGLTSGVASISAGAYHTCAVTTSGGAKCWGHNLNGQLGNNSTIQSYMPVDVVGLTSGVAAIYAGLDYTCAVTTAGGAKCWGNNTYGQLGNNSTAQSKVPVDVVGLTSGVVAIAAGRDSTCALTTGGGAKCWGANNYGQLGDGSTTQSLIPVDVSGLTTGVSSVTRSDFASCAVTTSGGAKCWGRNNSGQLGNNSTTNSLVPVDVIGLTSGVVAISGGATHHCAITTSGGAKCWGSNSSGKLGNNSTTMSKIPVDVSGLTTGVTRVSAGGEHTCVVTTSEGPKCWGFNTYGQLGNDSYTTSMVPVAVTN